MLPYFVDKFQMLLHGDAPSLVVTSAYFCRPEATLTEFVRQSRSLPPGNATEVLGTARCEARHQEANRLAFFP
jgi:hypothetical protein